MWHAALRDGLDKPGALVLRTAAISVPASLSQKNTPLSPLLPFILDSKGRSEALSVVLDGLQRGTFAVGDYGSYLQELCSALLPCLADNKVKIATQAAGVVELLCGGGLPEGALRGSLDALVPPLTELLGNAKVSSGELQLLLCLASLLALGLPSHHTPLKRAHTPPHTFFFPLSPRVARALLARCWRSWQTAAPAPCLRLRAVWARA